MIYDMSAGKSCNRVDSNLLISVVIPAYQAVNTIKRAVDSALSIPVDSVEVIVVDDGSTDGTAEVLSRISALDTRLRVIRQENSGRSVARNNGFNHSNGKWVMFLDADDYLIPGDYGALVDAAVVNNLGLIICQHSRPDTSKAKARDIMASLSDMSVVSADSLRRVMIDGGCSDFIEGASRYEFNAAWARLYRRDLIAATVDCLGGRLAPFPLGLRFSEDRLFNFEYLWLLGEGKVGFVPFCAYHWDIGSSATCGVVRSQDVDSLVRYMSVVEALRGRGLFDMRETQLLISREFMGQFNKAVKAGSAFPEVRKAWFRAFDALWLREHLVECPRESLGVYGELRPAWGLLTRGHLRAAFALYGALAKAREVIKH